MAMDDEVENESILDLVDTLFFLLKSNSFN